MFAPLVSAGIFAELNHYGVALMLALIFIGGLGEYLSCYHNEKYVFKKES